MNAEHEKNVRTEDEKKRKKRAAAAAVAVGVSAGVVVGGLFSDPAALVNDDGGAITSVYDDDDGYGGDEEDETTESRAAENVNRRESVRQWILRLPLWVRLLVILPLWCVGWAVLTVGSALWTAVLSPVLGKALGWVLLAAALLGAFVLAGKAIFPDMPLKKILNRRSVTGLLIGAVSLGAADIVVPAFWTGYPRFEAILRAAGILLVFGAVTVAFAVREHRRRRARAEAEAEAAAKADYEEHLLTRREILAMADSVSGRRLS